MNAQIRRLALVAAATALPISVFADAANSSTSPSSSTSSTTRSATGSTTGSTGTSGAGSSSASMGSDHMSSSSLGSASIRRVSESSIDRQFTAKALIGKDVYDSSNKKVGEIRDVVLDSSRAPELATALSMRSGRGHRSTNDNPSSNASGAGSTGATVSGNASGAGASLHGTAATGVASVDGTADRNTQAGLSGSVNADGSLTGSVNLPTFGAPSSSEPAAIVSYGGFMGAGGTLFRVPFSQLRYDSTNDRIALNISDSELSSLKNADTTRGAAE